MVAATKKADLDLAIIGSGPAAFTAAIYAARENLQVAIYERSTIGGLAATISKIENFPGFQGTGSELISFMRHQAESFGATVNYGECTKIQRLKNYFKLTIDEEPITARSVLVATGSERRKLKIPGEDLPGISYCATCDGPLTKDKEVVVIGGGNSAAQESFHLLKYCKKVTILARSALRCDDVLKERISKEPRIAVITGFTSQSITKKDQHLVVVSDKGTEQSADFIFIFAGMCPATSFLPIEILSTDGYVKTDINFSTSIKGLFAAGDCRQGSIKQAVVAAGEGAAAAVCASKYLESLK